VVGEYISLLLKQIGAPTTPKEGKPFGENHSERKERKERIKRRERRERNHRNHRRNRSNRSNKKIIERD
jgi:IS5 family transposase